MSGAPSALLREGARLRPRPGPRSACLSSRQRTHSNRLDLGVSRLEQSLEGIDRPFADRSQCADIRDLKVLVWLTTERAIERRD